MPLKLLPTIRDSRGRESHTLLFVALAALVLIYKFGVAGTSLFGLAWPPMAAGEVEGFVKVIFDAKDGKLLGAHLIGANVTEMVAEMVLAQNLGATGHQIIKAIHPHPTMSEAIMEAAAAAYGEVIHM